MMNDQPPSYEESRSSSRYGKGPKAMEKQHWRLDNQATVSRSWLVSAAAEKAYSLLEQRALCGIFKTRLVLIPQGQDCDISGDFKIAEFEVKPVTTELEGDGNSVEFWMQNQAIEELRRQIAPRIGGGRGGRLQVQLDRLHIRGETPFGLYETRQIMAIVVLIE